MKKPIYIGILLCVILAIISTIFAYDINIALEGCWGRYEGLFSILYYLSLMLLTTFISKKYKKIIVNSILICGAINAIYAICQIYNLFNVERIIHYESYWNDNMKLRVAVRKIWALGFTNNPNFFGTYMLLCLSYSLGLFVDNKKKIKRFIYLIISILFMFGLLISNTSAVAVGLFFVILYILIYCIKNKYYKEIIVIFTIIISTTFFAVKQEKTTLIKDIFKIGNETSEITKGNLDDDYGTGRIYIWKETLKVVPQYLLHGVGIDSFHKAFNGGALIVQKPTKKILYDKAHNEYLQLLVTQGIFALASYLFIYSYAISKGTRMAFKDKQIYFVLPVVGYLVQAFFNISVIEVAPIFWIALGLCCTQEKKIDSGKEIKQT